MRLSAKIGAKFTGLALAALLLLTACVDMPARDRPDGVLFSEQFLPGETGNWLTETDSLGRTAVGDGRLLIEVNTPHVMQFATLAEPQFTDFALEVDAVQLAGNRESSYGILFRMQDEQHFYRFDITAGGLFAVEKYSAAEAWVRLTDGWVESAAINQGLDATNRLKIVAKGTSFTFYVNEHPVHQLQDNSFAGGMIGLDAGTFAGASLQVAFDNLIVRRP